MKRLAESLRPVATPDRLERQRIAAREKWAVLQREQELEDRLTLHRLLVKGKAEVLMVRA